MSNAELFKHQKYLHLQGILPIDICKISATYALIKQEVNFDPETGDDAQTLGTHSVYADTLMESLLHFMHPHMEQHTGLNLFPTYAYYRVYRPGDELVRHKDRESCEISATVCLGWKYITKTGNYNWGLYMEPDIELNQDTGDVIIYRGCELDHWRKPFNVEPGSYQVQAFLHYVDVHGPYTDYFYDRRPGLGYPYSARKK